MYDVIVIGAGPSGSTAAYHCAKSGLKTLLLDKEKFPRDKICGGGFGLIFRTVPEETKNIVKQVTGDTKIYIDKYKLRVPGGFHMFRRKDFDYALLKRAIRAGARFKQSKVKSVDFKDYPKVKTNKGDYTARIVIGADGVNNTVAKSAGLFKKRKYAAAMVIEDKMPEELKRRYGNSAVLFYNNSILGYYWIFPKGNLVNLGVGNLTEFEDKTNLVELLCKFLDKNKISVDRSKIKGYPIPIEILPKVYANNVMLVGDSAGFVDPFIGGGIELGMISGKNAAKVAAEAVNANDFSERFLSRYVNECLFIYKYIKEAKSRAATIKFVLKTSVLVYLAIIFFKVQEWIKSKILKQGRFQQCEI
jgi:geranylgeranyl reductase family protein